MQTEWRIVLPPVPASEAIQRGSVNNSTLLRTD